MRTIIKKVQGYHAIDGAGVHLVRVLGADTVKEFDPILMLDSFDSTNPEDYKAGFPMHPHRGIETISYMSKGWISHRDSLGNAASIGEGEVQWMNSGSGIIHEEFPNAHDRLLGVQLWLNLPARDKMSTPTYHSITNTQIAEVAVQGGKVRVLAGSFEGKQGHQSEHLPLDYYDIQLDKGAELTIATPQDDSLMLFTLLGDATISGEYIDEKTAVKLSAGDGVTIRAESDRVQVLYIASKALKEPVAWAGPIVMNTSVELEHAFDELEQGSFIKEGLSEK
ncbi:pirin family protein [Atopobium fossor]|uniref:pirin family protein n=1 Tax=Atopobium fossor TaxID=39487 RepID=UPI0003FE3519|nr:pirin family protein [Atopobium fossor]